MAFENYELWDTHTLIGVYRETEAASTYWLDLLFPNELLSTDEWIDFEKIPSVGRKLAPFVAPMAQGRAIYEEGGRVARFKPAYIKPSDPVTPSRVMKRRPGSLLGPNDTTPQARYDAIKVDIQAYHRTAIERRWEWLAAKSVIDGKVTIDGDDYPSKLVDFGRAAGHTIVLGAGARWGEAGVSIKANLSSWSNTMHLAEFGGRPNRLTVGVDVWAVMEAEMVEGGELYGLLKTDIRGSTTDLRRDQIGTDEATFVGRLGTLDVWVYNDYYTVNGVVTPFMSSKDIVLSGPNVQGYRCFGAIQDVNAQFQALPVFPRNYVTQGDVAIEQIVTQSAPLMVPVNPNATLKATVLA
ncbi:major capsid protein [Rhizobium lentis]|uniref:major capsid protein n=1 Tax=Rhizobium lentis TaxID=1138194 RepID=UPI001C833B60|nr:major capsid protein [Rhizobium lentis]MBX5112694.1 major capsid protein [Rhizobium lentis]